MTEEKILKKLVELNEQIVSRYNEGKLQQKTWASLGLEVMRMLGTIALMLDDAKQEDFVDEATKSVKNMINNVRKLNNEEQSGKVD